METQRGDSPQSRASRHLRRRMVLQYHSARSDRGKDDGKGQQRQSAPNSMAQPEHTK
jgi:hypothetical protein